MTVYVIEKLIETLQDRLSKGEYEPGETLYLTIWTAADAEGGLTDGEPIDQQQWRQFCELLEANGSMQEQQEEVMEILWDDAHRS